MGVLTTFFFFLHDVFFVPELPPPFLLTLNLKVYNVVNGSCCYHCRLVFGRHSCVDDFSIYLLLVRLSYSSNISFGPLL